MVEVPDPTNLQFSVDTHIFRELGELLVGRDSTALLELIKNAYDADATRIVVSAFDLETPSRGKIVIEDNGCGMDEHRFKNGFLRIASRFKESDLQSPFFGRRYTGSKGIGRLAAHKLATLMAVSSVAGKPSSASKSYLSASIDWKRIEEKSTLDQLSNEIQLNSGNLPKARHPGTEITLSHLRRPWSAKERTRFIAECRSFQTPVSLIEPLPERLLPTPLLFKSPIIRDTTKGDPGCQITLEGEFEQGDDYWGSLIDQTNWVLEIDCRTNSDYVRYAVGPTKPTAKKYSDATVRRFKCPHPNPNLGPFFQARILVRDEQVHKKDVRDFLRLSSGVRVYVEGFRVLPYGEPTDDWLSLDSNYTRRSWETDKLFQEITAAEADAGDWQLLGLANRSYTGAVFLTQKEAPTLRMLVNREGFVAEAGYDSLVEIVRRGTDLLTRTRAAATMFSRSREQEERRQKRQSESSSTASSPKGQADLFSTKQPIVASQPRALADASEDALETVKDARRLLANAASPHAIEERLEFTETAIAEVISAADRAKDTNGILRVLASLGTQTASFVHEIRGLLGIAIAVHEAIDRLRNDDSNSRDLRAKLNQVYQSVGDLRRQIERQAAYLVDLTSTDARRRRSRLRMAERFEAATRLVAPAAERRGIEITNEIPSDIKSPPMFSAELTSVFSNLLSNAVKAAGKGGSIRASGAQRKDGAHVVIENTGVAVKLAESERWFRPFESSVAEVDSTLGLGMGLGLTITRDMLEQYGAMIRFAPPAKGYKTAVEIVFPGGKHSP